MPGIVPHPPTRIVLRGLRLLRPLLLAVLGLAVFAAVAGADEGVTAGGSTPVVEAPGPSPETPAATQPEPGTPEAPAPPAEQPAAANPPPSPDPTSEPPVAPQPPAAELPPPAAVEVPPLPAPEAAAPEVPAPAPVAPAPEYVAPAPESERLESAPEGADEPRTHAEGGAARFEGTGVPPLTRSGETPVPVATTPAPPAEGAPAVSLFELAPVSPFAALTGVAYGSTGNPASIVIDSLPLTATGCGSAAASCGSALPSIQRLLGESPAGYAAGGAGLAATRDNEPTGGSRGGSASGTPPLSSAPGPAPSGAAGGAGAGGPGGVAPTAFLTLAGLLLLAAPHARRRLRLSARPWRTAFFVLIPERPG